MAQQLADVTNCTATNAPVWCWHSCMGDVGQAHLDCANIFIVLDSWPGGRVTDELKQGIVVSE